MVFKKDLTPLTKKGSVTVHKGKGATQERLPSRSAVNTLTGGSPVERGFNNYAKETPSIQEFSKGGPASKLCNTPEGMGPCAEIAQMDWSGDMSPEKGE